MKRFSDNNRLLNAYLSYSKKLSKKIKANLQARVFRMNFVNVFQKLLPAHRILPLIKYISNNVSCLQ